MPLEDHFWSTNSKVHDATLVDDTDICLFLISSISDNFYKLKQKTFCIFA